MSSCILAFGASGRLGQALIRALAAADATLVAIVRTSLTPPCAAVFRWIETDVCDEDRWKTTQGTLCRLVSGHDNIIIVDLILDRRSVSAMRTSIGASVRRLRRLGELLSGDRHNVRYVLAGTTAATAPWPFQTPYGAAKRRQVASYLREQQDPVDVVLLPKLTDAARTAPPAWSYEDAAEVLTRSIHECPSEHRLLTPAPQGTQHRAAAPGWRRGTVAQISSVLWHRDSPTAHRTASHARLALVPARWRPLIDHHVAPEKLMRRFACRYQLSTRRVCP